MSDNEELESYDEVCDVTPEQFIKIMEFLYEHSEYKCGDLDVR